MPLLSPPPSVSRLEKETLHGPSSPAGLEVSGSMGSGSMGSGSMGSSSMGSGNVGPIPGAGSAGAGFYPRLFGKYVLLRHLGSGGMAEVDLGLLRSVAGFEKLVVIKRMLGDAEADPALRDLFLHEARIVGTMSHPHIVQVHDAGTVDGAPFMALEYVPGVDVRRLAHKVRNLGAGAGEAGAGLVPLEHALTIVAGVLSGLSYAHERRALDGSPLRIVHRDISPPNVLVSYGGHVKVTDFGIAQSGVPAPCAGHLRGKAPYMSPEQARGEAVDARSDLFSVGILLFELTTGKRLFKAPTEWETMRLICRQPYPAPSAVCEGYPEELEAIVQKALARERSQRYGSARAMLADLEGFARAAGIVTGPVGLASYLRQLFAEEAHRESVLLVETKQRADILELAAPPSEPASSMRLVTAPPSAPASGRYEPHPSAAPDSHARVQAATGEPLAGDRDEGWAPPPAMPSLSPVTYSPPTDPLVSPPPVPLPRARRALRYTLPLASALFGAGVMLIGLRVGELPRAAGTTATLSSALRPEPERCDDDGGAPRSHEPALPRPRSRLEPLRPTVAVPSVAVPSVGAAPGPGLAAGTGPGSGPADGRGVRGGAALLGQ